MADFLISFGKTNKVEAGYSNQPGDSGGETYAGISYNNFPLWSGWPIVQSFKPLKEGQFINDSRLPPLIQSFYHSEFWEPIGGDNLQPQELADQVYDMAVNSGVSEALKLLKSVS